MSLSIFEELYNKNDIYMADVVIKNLLNQEPGNQEIFKPFFDFKCKIANWEIDVVTRKRYIQEAKSGLMIYADNTKIDYDNIEYIKECQSIIRDIEGKIISAIEIKENEFEEVKRTENTGILNKLIDQKLKLETCIDENEYQGILKSVQQIENGLDSTYLDENQQQLYSELTQEYTYLLSEKATEFQRRKDLVYNQKAVESMKYAFDQFKSDEALYSQDGLALKRLVINHLFIFDVERFQPEVMVYYNQIYSYIFSKSSDELKFKMTLYAIESRRE